MTTTTQTPAPTTSTTSPQEAKPDAAAMWVTTIQALEAYKAECEAQDLSNEVERRRRAAEVERSLDDLARECRRLDREAAAKR